MTEPDGVPTWRQFLRSHARITHALDRELRARTGLPLAWYDVLLVLAEAPGGRLRMQDLASAVLFSRSGLTRLVDRLAAEGLVGRERAADDRRGSFAMLTPKGRRAFRRAAPVHLRGIRERFLDRLSPSDLEALRASLAKLDEGTPAGEPVEPD